MRIIGIDYGEKRIGVAFSDEGGSIAFPKDVIRNATRAAEDIVEYAHREKVGRIVIGESRAPGGAENAIMESARAFGDELKAAGLEVVYEAEQFSSVEAMRFQGENEQIDASAAAIILQRHLDKMRRAA